MKNLALVFLISAMNIGVVSFGQDEERLETPTSIETARESYPLGVTPYIVNGKIQGYRVYPKADRDLFRSLGLRPGDLITEIDGQPLSDFEFAYVLFETAFSGERVIFTVLRGDELEKVEVKID